MNNSATVVSEENSSGVSSGEPVLTTYPGELYVRNAHKAFGVTKALNGASFDGKFGEIHAIIGGNGCGKSTMAKVLAGVLPIDSGKVSIKGHHPGTPGESRSVGVAMVFQEVLVADEASVVDNLFIGSDGFFSKSMSDKEKEDKARELMSEMCGEPIDPLVPAGTLPLSIKAWITICRGFLCDPDLLILDESSAALDFDSTERLFEKMRKMRDDGTAIIIVTHRIAELVRVSDRCTVMRDGKDVGVLVGKDINEENLLRLMTGKSGSEKPQVGDAHKTTRTDVAVRTTNMKVWPDSEPVNFELLKGEIVGVTGLDGHGQDDFVRILAGVKLASEGYTQVSPKDGDEFVTIKSLDDAKKNDIGFVSGDRKREGILPNLSIYENLLIPLYPKYVKLAGVRLIDWFGLSDIFDWEVERLAIKTGPKENLITSLSGGNQQKVMLGRAFAQHPTTLNLLDPARGIDLHTKRDLYKQLREFADEGSSVIYMSSELEEFIGFCSRVLVFRNGSIFETFRNENIEAVGMLESMFGRAQGGEVVKPAVKATPVVENVDSSNEKAATSETSSSAALKQDESQQPGKSQSSVDGKDGSDKKTGSDVSKYNVSKYFKTEHDTPNVVSHSKEGYSGTDEEQFEKLMGSSGGISSALHVYDESRKKEHLPESIEYKDADNHKFDALMEFGNSKTAKHSGAAGLSAKTSEGYSQSDEQAFDKLTASTSEDATESTNTSTQKSNKTARSGATVDEGGSEAPSVEYSEQDLQKFKGLMGD